MYRRGIIVASGFALAGVFATSALSPAQVTESGNSDPTASAPSGGTGIAAAQQAFAVMRRVGRPADVLDADHIGKIARDPVMQALEIDWTGARRATTEGGFVLHLVPARNHVCLVATNQVTGTDVACADAAAVAAKGLVVRTAVGDGNATVLTGLIPDGVSAVTVSGKSSMTASVRGNAFVAPLTNGGGTLTWSDARGAHSIGLPADPRAGE